MNNFQSQLEQSQNDAELYRWEYSYRQYFSTIYGDVNRVINTDTLDDSAEWQSKGVDHIVECENCDIFVDFMLREKSYNDFFLEYEVNGRPGKFFRDDILTQFIAYSYRQSPFVMLFPFPQARRMVRNLLESECQPFRRKTSISSAGGRQWQTKGIIVPHTYVMTHMEVHRIDM